jgi:SAM-dependent methyltransferase
VPHHHHATHDQPGHGHGHGQDGHEEVKFTQEFWDDRYSSAGRLWSGKPNAQLVEQASGLEPGEALDAGCGEGGDAVWLAGQGWAVTAVDVSAVAIERGARAAEAVGADVAGRIRWQREDLLTWAPEPGRYGLVSAQYMHLPPELFGDFFARMAAAVRPGGTLLVVGHHPDDLHANVGRTGAPDRFVLAEQLAAGLDPAAWDVVVARAFDREARDLDGQPVNVRDTVLRAVRRA